MNFDRLRLVADLANFGLRTEAMLVISIPESPGEFLRFIDTALNSEDGSKITVSEFKYRYSVDRPAKILFSLSTESPEAIESAVQRLGEAGYQCQNVTGSGAAQLHLRHMVGGRPRSYTGSIDHEKMVVVRPIVFLLLFLVPAGSYVWPGITSGRVENIPGKQLRLGAERLSLFFLCLFLEDPLATYVRLVAINMDLCT